jgi:outer membrane protein TolC
MSLFHGDSLRPRNGLTSACAESVRFALLLVASLIAPWAGAEDLNLPLTLAEAERLALTEEPGQISLLERADALEERSVAAAQLPDPAVRVGLMNYPAQHGDFTTEPMTQAQVGVRQAFPPGRAARRRELESMSAELDQSAQRRARDVKTAVRQAWLDAYYWNRAEAIVTELHPLFSDLVTVTRSLYAVGRKDQQDVLRAELELSRLDDRVIDISRQMAHARAALSEWVGTSEARRALPQQLPAWEDVAGLEELTDRLASHPALRAAQARIDAREEGVELARQQYKPDWMVDVGYGYRGGERADGRSRPGFVSVMLTLDVPLFRRNRQDRTFAAALSEQRAASASRDELRRRLLSRLESEYYRWRELSRRVDLYQRRIVPQAQEHARAALAAYQSEAADFSDVMRGYIDELDTRLEHVRLRVERAQSYAVIANLGGIEP